MTKKIFIFGVLGLMTGLTSAFADETPAAAYPAPSPTPTVTVTATVRPREDDVRFSCTFEGPAVVVKGAVPLVCTAFGEFERDFDRFDRDDRDDDKDDDHHGDRRDRRNRRDRDDDDHLTVICGNAVLYSDGVIATSPTNNTTELRSVVPGVTTLTIRSLNQGFFRGPLGSILRIDIPGAPQALLTGVCHLNRRHGFSGPFADLE
jgi:hypothetical protein